MDCSPTAVLPNGGKQQDFGRNNHREPTVIFSAARIAMPREMSGEPSAHAVLSLEQKGMSSRRHRAFKFGAQA